MVRAKSGHLKVDEMVGNKDPESPETLNWCSSGFQGSLVFCARPSRSNSDAFGRQRSSWVPAHPGFPRSGPRPLADSAQQGGKVRLMYFAIAMGIGLLLEGGSFGGPSG